MRKILLIVATFLLVVACSKDDVNEPKEPKEPKDTHPVFSFLTIGNRWIYIEHIQDEYQDVVYTIKRKKVLIDSVNSVIYKHYHYLDSDNDGEWTIFVATDSTAGVSGQVLLGVLLLENYTVGKQWQNKEVVSINETITVKAGTFENCIKIKETFANAENIWWVRNDIGIIKCEFKYTSEDKYLTARELKSKNF